MKAIIVGIGNPLMKDDGVGFKVVEALEGVVDTVTLLNTDLKVIQKILNYDLAIIVDGLITGAPPGSILEVDPANSWKNVYSSGTHSMTLFEVLRIGYHVFPEEMPKEVKIIGIEVKEIRGYDPTLSPEVKAAVPKAVDLIKNYLKARRVIK